MKEPDTKKDGEKPSSIPNEVHERAKKLAKAMLKLPPDSETADKEEQG